MAIVLSKCFYLMIKATRYHSSLRREAIKMERIDTKRTKPWVKRHEIIKSTIILYKYLLKF